MARVTANLIRYRPGARMNPHTDGCRRLSIVVSGTLAEGAEWALEQGSCGSVAIKEPGWVHHTSFGDTGTIIVSAIVPDRLLRTLTGSPEGRTGWRWLHDGTASLLALRAAAALLRHDGANSAEALRSLCIGHFGTVPRYAPAPRTLERVRRRLVQARVQGLESTDHDATSVAQLAAESKMHPVALSRAFRRHFGCSPTRYRQQHRVAAVARSLLETDEDLVQIALRHGFSDSSHLTRVFRREVALPPGAFRQTMMSARRFDSFKTEWSLGF